MGNEKESGLRFNQGKTRYDLMEPFALRQKAQIFTKGALKYSENNWLQGMSWSKCYASALRHQAAWARGEDYDIDENCADCIESKKSGVWSCRNHTGELHSALAAWNWDAITSYYKHHPQGDDRLHKYLKPKKIGLDIDEVICDFTKGWGELNGTEERPESWYYDREMSTRFDKMRENGTLDTFYLSLKPKINPNDIPFEPHCYVTSRPVDTTVTQKWLDKHKFPGVKIITVKVGESKAKVLKDAGVDIFVDDAYHNFVDLNKNGVCCYLYDAPHNQRYSVGHKRIKSLSELA